MTLSLLIFLMPLIYRKPTDQWEPNDQPWTNQYPANQISCRRCQVKSANQPKLRTYLPAFCHETGINVWGFFFFICLVSQKVQDLTAKVENGRWYKYDLRFVLWLVLSHFKVERSRLKANVPFVCGTLKKFLNLRLEHCQLRGIMLLNRFHTIICFCKNILFLFEALCSYF